MSAAAHLQPPSDTAEAEPDDRRFLDRTIETMPREALRAMQERRLLAILPHIYERSGLIRATWQAAGVGPADIASLEDFRARVPCIDKDDIRAHRDKHADPMGGLGIVPLAELEVVGFTSGTTGDPTPVPSGRLTAVEIEVQREFWHIGARPGDYVTYMMFTFRGGQSRIGFLGDAGVTPITMPHDPAQLPLMIEAIRLYRPTIIYMLSTPMMIGFESYFEAHPEVDPRELFASVRGGVFGGEPMSPRFAALARKWGIEIFDYTTLGDVTGAMDCRAHNGFHAWEDLAFVENLDDDGNQVADGELGEMVVTSLEDPWAPLVRFRTGDLCRMDHAPCPCGRTHLRFWIAGRKGDQTTVQGRPILPRDIQGVVERQPETRSALFQIIRAQAVMDVLRLRVGFEAEMTPEGEQSLRQRLTDSVHADFGVPVEVELVPASELLKLGPPQKIPRVTTK